MAPKRPAASAATSASGSGRGREATSARPAACDKTSANDKGTPKVWPPKVPLGPFEDVLPLVEADDDSLDTLILPYPGLVGGAGSGSFGPEEVEYICKCLQNNTSVTHLNTSFNPLGDQGAAHIASLLAGASKLPLVRLSLNGCGISAIGAQALAEGLGEANVEVVELMNNIIDDEGGEALLAALQRNKRWKQLQVSFNQISDPLQSRIEQVLRLR
ncbi:unnamed protein product [Polarella glacialis]|uniref:Uncharacterized protein n=1 Tax=Polarella glacialis TaxID=89957 RepID=A0A813KA20_POLGL|nr:unnamed protein product [Polarella glacialis]